MSKPEDISQEAWGAGEIWAAEYAQWLHAGNSRGSLSPDAIRGLTDQIARAIMAAKIVERARCVEVVADYRDFQKNTVGNIGLACASILAAIEIGEG